jgi:hypothetical protein
MSFRVARIRAGEWIMGLAGLALIVVVFALPWYGFYGTYSTAYREITGGATSYAAIPSLNVFGPLALLAGVGGLSTWWLQGTRRAPAVPVSSTVLTTALTFVVLVGLFVRVVVALPYDSTFIEPKAGAWAGLGLSALLLLGGYVSLRQDGIRPEDGPGTIETLRLTHRGAAT